MSEKRIVIAQRGWVFVGDVTATESEVTIENAASAELRLDADVIARLSSITEPLKKLLGNNADPWEHVSRMEKP